MKPFIHPLTALITLALVIGGIGLRIENFREENTVITKFGNVDFIQQVIDPNKIHRVATIGISNVIVRFAEREAFVGQAAFAYKPFAEWFYKIIAKQLESLTPEQHKVVTSYNYMLDLMLPRALFPLGGEVYYGGLPDDLGIDFELLKAANVTHIITTHPHPQLDAASIRRYENGNPPRPYLAPLDTSSLSAIIKNLPLKLARLKEPYPLLIYEVANAKDRVYFVGQSGQESKASITHYSPDNLEIDATTNEPGRLHVSNNYHPNWHAHVNGNVTAVLPGESPFQEIPISGAGNHKIVLSYEDFPLQVLTWFSQPVSFLLLAFFYRRRQFSMPVENLHNV